jgi:NADH-quinone oxidoreductase subunit A
MREDRKQPGRHQASTPRKLLIDIRTTRGKCRLAMSFDLAMILGFLFVSTFVLWLLLFVSRFVRMQAPTAAKLRPYECGEKPFGPAWFNFNNRFYVIALVFVAFDVQVALAVPIIVIFRRLVQGGEAGFAFGVLFAFLGVMMLALGYVWRQGDLGWVRHVEGGQKPELANKGGC